MFCKGQRNLKNMVVGVAAETFFLKRAASRSLLIATCWSLIPGIAGAAAESPAAAPAAAATSVEQAAAVAPNQSNQIQEVVVTAQKRRQDVKDIPISISALSGQDLARAHIQGYEDLTREVPSVSFAAGGAGGNGVGEGETFVEIRGVSSTSGTATTGLYLDDTSISVNQNAGVGAFQPLGIDLARIEVLRGPQGTLYGASSEGGTVRFIQNQPKLDVFEGKVSADLSGTMRGGVNYFGSAVLNIPILPDKLAIRGDIGYGDDSGWIDNYSLSGALQKTGVNDVRREQFRLAALFKPNDDWTITPDFFLQRSKQSDAPIFEINDPAFAAANSFVIPPPVPSDGLYRQHFLSTQYIRDTDFVPSLTVQYATAVGDFTSVSSYLYRGYDRQTDGQDYDPFYIANYLNLFTPNPRNLSVIGSLASPTITPSTFNNVSQEFRFDTHKFDVYGIPIHAVGGLYYSDQAEVDREFEPAIGISRAFQSIYGYGINSPQSPIGDPAVPNYWGDDVTADWHDHQQTAQYSTFGQIDVDILPTLHASAGLRYVYARIATTVLSPPHFFNAIADNSANEFVSLQRDYAVTPKFSLTYDVSANANIYTTIAKGYRLGGADTLPPPVGPTSVCNADFQYLGIKAPSYDFGPDNVWSYEAGSKMRLLGNTVSLDVAGYDIEWSKIQQEFLLPFCGFPYSFNAGNARSYGGEFQMTYKPSFIPGFTFGLNGSLSHATITSSTSPTIVGVGEDVLFVPQYTVTFSGDYRWPINDDMVAFIRGDYDMTGRSHGSYIASNPGYVNHAYGILNGAVGVTMDDLEVDLYAKNLANDHTLIQTPTLNAQVAGYTVRPLTFGVTVTKNF